MGVLLCIAGSFHWLINQTVMCICIFIMKCVCVHVCFIMHTKLCMCASNARQAMHVLHNAHQAMHVLHNARQATYACVLQNAHQAMHVCFIMHTTLCMCAS